MFKNMLLIFKKMKVVGSIKITLITPLNSGLFDVTIFFIMVIENIDGNERWVIDWSYPFFNYSPNLYLIKTYSFQKFSCTCWFPK